MEIDNILDEFKDMRILMKAEIDIMNRYIRDIDMILDRYNLVKKNVMYFELIFYGMVYYIIFSCFYKIFADSHKTF